MTDRIIEFEGRRIAVPADATDAEVAGILGGQPAPAASPPAAPSVLGDVAKSAAVGVANGVIGLAGLPGTLADLGQQGLDFAIRKGTKLLTGTEPSPISEASGYQANPLSAAKIRGATESVTGNFYEPKTTAGAYARTLGEFAPSGPIGPGGAVAKIAGNVLLPAIVSEAAGQATQGTAIEPYARFAGGLAAGVAGAGARSYVHADNAIAARAAQGVTPEQFDVAQRLHETAARIGVPLSGPEAVQEATRGATKLADVQRTVEGSLSGGARTAPFYAQRPDQIDAATRRVLDAIAPQAANPSTLGPRAAQAAEGAIDDVRRGINTATRPAYRAAEAHLLDPEAFDPISRDPAFQASLRRLRGDEVLGPTYRDMPDNSIAVVDAVTKDMRDRGIALGNATNPGFSSQTSGLYGSGAAEARDIARTPARGGSQAYDDALTMQAQARRDNLDPLEQGPLGRIAAGTTTPAAYGEILPSKPLAGGSREIVDAVTRLRAQDPDLPPALVRQSLGDQFDQARRRISTGENQSAGGRFANAVAGTPEQQVALRAVLDAIGRPGVRDQTEELLDVLRATSQRRPMGSPTAPNQMIDESLNALSLPRAIANAPASAGTTVFSAVKDRVRLAARDRAYDRLADMFLAPDSVQQIRALGARGAEHPTSAMLLRQALQTQAQSQ